MAMDGLWRWDIETFRAIHLGGRSFVAEPLLRSINDMGLFHVQGVSLLLVALRSKLPVWALSHAVGLSLALSFIVEQRGVPGASAVCLCLILFWRLSSRAAYGAFAAASVAGILRVAVEKFVDRQRPSNFDFAIPLEAIYGHSSFPSGHSTTTMAIAVYLAWSLLDDDADKANRPIAFLALIWALLVGVSRIVAGVHYPLDVLAGFALGMATATGTWLLFSSRGWDKEAILPQPEN